MTFTFTMGEITSAYTYGGHTHYANARHKNVSQRCPTGLNLCNCSRLRGRVGLQSKFRAWLPLCERPDGPRSPQV